MRPLTVQVSGLLLGLVLWCPALATAAAPEQKRPPWELAKAKLDAASRTCLAIAQEYLEGKATIEQVNLWSRRWLDAQRDVGKKKDDQIAALEGHVKRMKDLEEAAQRLFERKRGPASDVSAAEYHRLEAELTLSKFKTSK